MEEIFSKNHFRRTFFLVVALVLVLALGTRFFALPYFAPTQVLAPSALVGSLLDNLVISLFLAVFLGGFVFWLTPDIVRRSEMEVIAPKQINSLLKRAATDTRSWFYKGACGRYTRATTLPMLANAAKVQGIGRDISVCLLNPNNDGLCSEYATYRKSLKSGTSGVAWTQKSVQEEILATAVAVLRYQYSEPLLRIRLFFVDHFSAFRLDVSDQYVVVTKEDKEASALRADAGTYFYDSYKDDIRLTERQSEEISCSGALIFEGSVDEAKLREAIACAQLFDTVRLDGLDINRLLGCINNPSDPY